MTITTVPDPYGSFVHNFDPPNFSLVPSFKLITIWYSQRGRNRVLPPKIMFFQIDITFLTDIILNRRFFLLVLLWRQYAYTKKNLIRRFPDSTVNTASSPILLAFFFAVFSILPNDYQFKSAMEMKNDISTEEKARAVFWKQEGVPNTKIATCLGCHPCF